MHHLVRAAPVVAFLAAAQAAAAIPAAAAAPSVRAVGPATIRLNSVVEVSGSALGPNGADRVVVLSGRVEDGTGASRDVAVRLPGVAVGDRTVRAPLTAEAVRVLGGLADGSTSVAPGRFVGHAAVEVGGRPNVAATFDVFPPDVLTVLAGFVGFAEGSTAPPWWAIVATLLAAALFLLLAVFALFAGLASWAERRIAGRMQNRVGPNRVGPQGVFQWLADGLKAFLKEDFVPPGALPVLFRIAPYFAMLGVVLTFVTLPFGQFLTVSDLNVGVYYVLAVTGFTVIGILIGGFASANKWSLLGGFRSAAQIVSYEIPAGLAVAAVVALAGSLGLGTIIARQGGFPWEWYLFHDPFTLAAFFVYFTSALAEGNRTPFDLPEAESELVAGYSTEYSGLRFLFYFFAEWGNLYVMSALMTALFLGGWQVPGVAASAAAASPWLIAAGWALFTAKALFLVFVVIWLRWTLPRVRVDQLMAACWKYLVPIGATCFLGAAAWGVLVRGVAEKVVSIALFAAGVAVAVVFVAKVAKTLRKGPIAVKLSPFA
ncbi:MAG: NADH-quinone oxidoreductase subunit NuoH [Deltaproteobacteria bacterium]|nr:NADH-quinone oxidoreductase subunit NuoH [Deltaproteobacteria bacterium]